jgi:SAM-dependent methyltransferase
MLRRTICPVCQKDLDPYLHLTARDIDEPFFCTALKNTLPELRLNRCPQCESLWNNDARLDQNLLLEIYASIPASYFGGQSDDARYKTFYKQLEKSIDRHARRRRILDVGCGEGSFLASLPETWQASGVEPSRQGALISIDKGLDVRQGILSDIPICERFDVISAIDVVEHLIDFESFFHEMKSRLSMDGIVVIVTGDRSSFAARVAGRRWSYLRWCGHVSIFTMSSIECSLRKVGFSTVDKIRCSHPASAGIIAWWRVFLLEPIRRLFKRPPSWYPYWQDHMIIIARLERQQ